MDAITLITLVVAVYAAVIATILGVRELGRVRRGLDVRLERLTEQGRKQITITNHGARPITLIDLVIDVPHGPVPPPELAEGIWPFPLTLHAGDHRTIMLTKLADMTVDFDDPRVEISVFDVQGTEYRKFSRRDRARSA